MAIYTKEEIAQAKEMDLLTYLETYEPFELVRENSRTYTTREHDSLKISNGMWYWFSRGFGARSAVDYLIKVRGYPFPMAIGAVLGKPVPENAKPKRPIPRVEKRVLALPELSNSTDEAEQYLVMRGIDPEIIRECIDRKLILQTKDYANVVFAGYDRDGTMKFAAMRGTRSAFKGDCRGSDKSFSFLLEESQDGSDVHIFEAAIDLLSYATLLKLSGRNWHEYNLLSLSGIYVGKPGQSNYSRGLIRYLNEHPKLKTIHLHLDNDDAGRKAGSFIRSEIGDRYEVLDEPSSEGKDINDELRAILSRKREKNYER